MSSSSGPACTFKIGGVRTGVMMSGTVTMIGCNGSSALGAAGAMKLIGSSGRDSTNGGVPDPFLPNPFEKFSSASCWATRSSSMRVALLSS
ncbi:hypothetical protein [Bradyrhizobium japonicum]|uniref:hypothetical protein n=1 Tax=Bradyrhizobium japonicum TaxID=375 RepID=UPI001AF02228|nr:hypothetical protein [Bradyrhizobium japonicum]